MSSHCIASDCKKPVHKHGFRFCADHAIAFLQQQIKHAETRVNDLPLRDYFAGQALAGMGTWMPPYTDLPADLTDAAVLKARADWAYLQAIAMLAARKEQPHD